MVLYAFERRNIIGHIIRDQKWFEDKVNSYWGGKVEVLSKYNGSEKPIDIVYHCQEHGDTFTTINAKNVCKPYCLPCKMCQSIRKSKSAKKSRKMNKNFYYNRLVEYCKERGGYVIETEWTKAKDEYHFKCGNAEHPVFETTADALYSGEHWCPYCSGRKGFFQDELSNIVNSKDGELLSTYVDSSNPVSVKCNKHNYVWNILPSNIKKGRWCPICSMGFNEKTVWDYLKAMDCNFDIQYGFDDLLGKNGEKLRFDFAIFDSSGNLFYLIEIDDEEHRHKHLGNSPRQMLRKESMKRDSLKNKYCENHNIPLYRMNVPFTNLRKWGYDDYYRFINTELKEIINKSKL